MTPKKLITVAEVAKENMDKGKYIDDASIVFLGEKPWYKRLHQEVLNHNRQFEEAHQIAHDQQDIKRRSRQHSKDTTTELNIVGRPILAGALRYGFREEIQEPTPVSCRTMFRVGSLRLDRDPKRTIFATLTEYGEVLVVPSCYSIDYRFIGVDQAQHCNWDHSKEKFLHDPMVIDMVDFSAGFANCMETSEDIKEKLFSRMTISTPLHAGHIRSLTMWEVGPCWIRRLSQPQPLSADCISETWKLDFRAYIMMLNELFQVFQHFQDIGEHCQRIQMKLAEPVHLQQEKRYAWENELFDETSKALNLTAHRTNVEKVLSRFLVL